MSNQKFEITSYYLLVQESEYAKTYISTPEIETQRLARRGAVVGGIVGGAAAFWNAAKWPIYIGTLFTLIGATVERMYGRLTPKEKKLVDSKIKEYAKKNNLNPKNKDDIKKLAQFTRKAIVNAKNIKMVKGIGRGLATSALIGGSYASLNAAAAGSIAGSHLGRKIGEKEAMRRRATEKEVFAPEPFKPKALLTK